MKKSAAPPISSSRSGNGGAYAGFAPRRRRFPRRTRRRRPSPPTPNFAESSSIPAVTPLSSSSPGNTITKRRKIQRQNDDEDEVRVAQQEDIQWKKASTGNVQVEIKGNSSSFAKKEYVTVIDSLCFVSEKLDQFGLFSAEPHDQQQQFPTFFRRGEHCEDDSFSWVSSDSISCGDKIRFTFHCRSSRNDDVKLFEKLDRSGKMEDVGTHLLQRFLKILRRAPERHLSYAVSIVISSGSALHEDPDTEGEDDDMDDDDKLERGKNEKATFHVDAVANERRKAKGWLAYSSDSEGDSGSVVVVDPKGIFPAAPPPGTVVAFDRTPPRHPWHGFGKNPWTLMQSECLLAAVALVGPQEPKGYWKMIAADFGGPNHALWRRSSASLTDRWHTMKRQGVFQNVACHKYKTLHKNLIIPNGWKWDKDVVPLLLAIASQPKDQDEDQRWALLASSKEANPNKLSPQDLENIFYSMVQVHQAVLIQKLRK